MAKFAADDSSMDSSASSSRFPRRSKRCALRRRHRASGEIVLVAAADPLNLVGIVVPGARVSRYSGQVIAYRDGVAAEIGELGAVRSRLQIG